MYAYKSKSNRLSKVEKLKELQQRIGVNISFLAREAGYSPAYLHSVLSGKNPLTENMRYRLSDTYIKILNRTTRNLELALMVLGYELIKDDEQG